MAAQDSGGNGGIIGGINVTPLVDVTLVLLIIFIVTAKIIVMPAVGMDLPKATRSDETQIIFSVLLPLNGPTLVDGEAAGDDATLLDRARAAAAKDPEIRAVINADTSVTHGRVIHALDVLKTAGIVHIAFGTSADDVSPGR
jgi:biopolymer transport protein ExbD